MDREAAIQRIEDPAASRREDVQFVFQYWEATRNGRMAPPWPEIDLVKLPPMAIPYITVADVIDGGAQFRYRFWGSGHAGYHGTDYTGKTTDDVAPASVGRMLREEYSRVVTDRAPFLFHEFLADYVPDAISLRLPLSDDGETVTGILSYAGRQDYLDEVRKVFGTD